VSGEKAVPDLAKLQREVKAWNRQVNRKRTKINWRFTRQKARKLFRYREPRAKPEKSLHLLLRKTFERLTTSKIQSSRPKSALSR
jgi:hypothetical protein